MPSSVWNELEHGRPLEGLCIRDAGETSFWAMTVYLSVAQGGKITTFKCLMNYIRLLLMRPQSLSEVSLLYFGLGQLCLGHQKMRLSILREIIYI